MSEITSHLHGRLGVFCGGEWIPMKEAPERWNHDIEEVVGTCSDAERCKKLPKDEHDVIVIGAGCVGSSVARELSKSCLKVLVVEKADDVTQGATKGNSGIVHAGYDDSPGSVRAKYCPVGNRMFPDLDKDLKFGFQKNGSLVVARGEHEHPILDELLSKGKTNGVKGLKILNQEELRQVEPNINPDATAALYAPSAGIVIPFEFTIALAENAANNGVEFRCQCEVTSIQKEEDHFAVSTRSSRKEKSSSSSMMGLLSLVALMLAVLLGALHQTPNLPDNMKLGIIGTFLFLVAMMLVLLQDNSSSKASSKEPQVLRTKYVVNAAGLYSDKIAAMIGDNSFHIKPRIGEYLLMKRPNITNKEEPPLCRHVVFPCPGKMGKGILAQPTLWGNLCLGPTAHDFKNKENRSPNFNAEERGESKSNIISHLLSKCRELIPSIEDDGIIHSFAGVRAKSSRGDWIVEPSSIDPCFVHAAGIDSPGLAGSPAIAMEVVRLLGEAGLTLIKNPHFNPKRKPYVKPKGNWKMIDDNGKEVTIKKEHPDPKLNVICRCELVTESEVVDAIQRGKKSSIKVENTQQVRKRTRAGMGWCQGQYCQPKVQELIARELGVKTSDIGVRAWPESSLLESQHQYADNK